MSKRRSVWGIGAVAIAAMVGCSGGSGSGVGSGLESSERYVAERAARTEGASQPGVAMRESGGQFATVAGSAVDWERVRPLLAEAAGAFCFFGLARKRQSSTSTNCQTPFWIWITLLAHSAS